jgi:branched-chain amino acid aminotransferase
MSCLVDVDGTLLPASQARISVYDQGFLFGASVYETIRTYGGRPFLLDRHLDRLACSAQAIHMDPEAFLPALPGRIERALAAADHEESLVRIVASRGQGRLTYAVEPRNRPTVVLLIEPLDPPPASLYERGVSVAVVSVRRNSTLALDPAIKSSNLLNNFLAAAEARALDADEALMLNERGELAEGASTNVFAVHGARVRTPPTSAGLLDGITRRFVLDLCRAEGLDAGELTLMPQDLDEAREIFLTSTTREILPVGSCNGRRVGEAGPGPVTRRLTEAFRRAVETAVAEEA